MSLKKKPIFTFTSCYNQSNRVIYLFFFGVFFYVTTILFLLLLSCEIRDDYHILFGFAGVW